MSKLVKPYGDTQNDGKVQLSFTLPVQRSEAADEAARQLAAKMGFNDVQVVDGRSISSGFSFFVLYGSTAEGIDVDTIHAPSSRTEAMSMDEIDAILNMKGYKGDYGLERYRMFEAFNLGSQVAAEELVRYTKEHRIDALLVSQVVTQKGSDIKNFTQLSELLEAEGLRDGVVLICGGPRVTNRLASELGYDAGFGRGTLPSEVAAFVAVTMADRLRQAVAQRSRAGE